MGSEYACVVREGKKNGEENLFGHVHTKFINVAPPSSMALYQGDGAHIV